MLGFRSFSTIITFSTSSCSWNLVKKINRYILSEFFWLKLIHINQNTIYVQFLIDTWFLTARIIIVYK